MHVQLATSAFFLLWAETKSLQEEKMKKSLLLLFFAVTALLGFGLSTRNINVDAAAAGQVVFHYQKWDGVYDDVGLWVWNTGTDGSADAVTKAGEDDFGAYFEIAIGADATTMGLLPISEQFSDSTNRWSYKDTKDDADLNIDVSAAAAGGTINAYFFSGMNGAFIASSEYINIFVVYFTASETYESNLGIHAWGGWYNDAEIGSWGVWGTPTPIFSNEFYTPEGKLGKIGMVQAVVDGGTPNLIIYAGTDATKKTGDVAIDVEGLVAGDCTALYAAAEQWQGFDNATLFADSSFAFKFTPFTNVENVLDGTYAIDASLIQVKFSAEVTSAYYDPESPIITTVSYYEIVGYNYVPTGEGGITIDDTVYDPYVATDIPAGMARVVFHYQKWDSNYSNVGLWAWSTGTDGTGGGVTKAGVDDFGAVFEVNLGVDVTTMGFIPIAAEMDNDNRWNYKDSLDDADVNLDLTGIAAGEIVNVYFFSGTSSDSLFIANPDKANFLVVYLNQTATYEESLGVHNWNMDVNATGWGTPLPMISAFVTPDGVPGKAIMLSDDSPTDGGIIVHAGDTKYSGDANIEGTVLTSVGAGEVAVIYTGVSGETSGSYSYTTSHDDFVMELMVPTEKVPVYDYVDYEVVSYERSLLDVASMFVLLEDGVEVEGAIGSVSFKEDVDVITELVIELASTYTLDNTKTYTLAFDNGAEGLDNRSAEIDLNLDDEVPVITVLMTQQLTFVAGTEWDDSYWPNILASDNRDGDITDRIYIESGEGTVNFGVPGTYPVTVTVYDNWGNEGNATFNFTITAPETGCAATNASIGLLGLLGVVVFFVRRKEWL
jgi:hypothetical protein